MKKRLFSVVTAVLLALCCFSFAACSEIKNGSKIQRMTMVLEFTDANGDKDVKDIGIELYLNFAPETTAAFMELAENGYYDGVCVYNVANSCVEFGAYKAGEGGKLVANDKTGKKINGEFKDNGWTGNTLSTSSSGILVMKRNEDDKDDAEHNYYNSATGNVVVTIASASGVYPSDSYCAFGRLTMDDADKNPKESYSDSSKVNRTGKSSLDVFKTIGDLKSGKEDGATVKAYYDSKADKYYTYIEETDEETSATEKTWFEGLGGEKVEITDKKVVEELEKKITEEKYTFFNLPYTSVVIKSIRKA